MWTTIRGSVAWNAAFAAIGVGVGALIRNLVGAIAAALAWVAVVEGVVGQLVGSFARWRPFNAGQTLGEGSKAMTTENLLPRWGGDGVLAVYTVVFAVLARHHLHAARRCSARSRLTACHPEHIADMSDLIEEWNTEIRLAREEGRRPVLELDKRQRSGIVGIATQRRIFATLRTALNAARKARPIDQNPCNFVEMPAEHRDPANGWSPEQVVIFLEHCEATKDRLAVLFRLVLLHGLRRGEAVGARRARFDHQLCDLTIARPLPQLGGQITESTPKTRAGERLVVLDSVTADLVRIECVARMKEKLKWGSGYADNDLIFCWEDGTPYGPDYVSRRFRELTAAAGLPRIKSSTRADTPPRRCAWKRRRHQGCQRGPRPQQHQHHPEPLHPRPPDAARPGERRGRAAAAGEERAGESAG